MSKDENEDLRIRSGSIDTDEKLVSFLYSLMRDHLPCGIVEELVRDSFCGDGCEFSNGFLANYAKDLASRLKND